MSKSTTEPMDDVLKWLTDKRDEQTKVREEMFEGNDFVNANRADRLAMHFHAAVSEIEDSRKKLDAFTTVLKSRILIALSEASNAPWRATHKHYKGTLYRVTGTRLDVNGSEAVESVEYDDQSGRKFVIHKSRWDSRLESGQPRYQEVWEERA